MSGTVMADAAVRIPTGILGLDERIGGGFPRDRAVLVCGDPDSGKSTFGLHFLMEGVRRGEPAVLIRADATRPPLNHRLTIALEASPLFTEFGSRRSADAPQVESDLARLVRHLGVKRLVIDDIDALMGADISPAGAADFLRSLLASLEDNLACTAALTVRTAGGTHHTAAGVVAARLASGVIEMFGASTDRWIRVRKMRGAPSVLEPYFVGGLSAPRSLSASEPNPSTCATVSRAV